jgi:hypothetical protein
MEQTKLFERKKVGGSADGERLALYALGEFQARGKSLAGRELPLDRLRGALRRAAEDLETEELEDEAAAAAFASLGAQVRRVPPFVAKHPYRIVVATDLAERARKFYEKLSSRTSDETGADESVAGG